ncbi:dihydropyrimidinase [Roseomonas sp. NAR14]|uniref:Dihydropyrimidinase n=1 Tax=Roseomonas acroporae TaxID=2937791 RepID=A0A9X2BW69_9PROT|nr:dihydropyrimidinase [Roseomonas acroporae]MCK8787453.1 dihydropyrimidinase [Roseomonas acroporae]
MAEFDLAVRGGLVATGCGTTRCDIGVKDGRVVALGERLADAARTVDAGGLLVLPGGVDSHCHIEQPDPDGTVYEETFLTGSRSAFAGGTTSVVCFVPGWKGASLAERVADYEKRAATGMLDYGFHLVIAEATDATIAEIPQFVARGMRSLKVFLTYDDVHLDDRGYLRVLAAARRTGALVTVHCENYDAIKWRTEALLAAGLTEPRYHAWSRPVVVEREATHRAIALAELVDQPIQIFHVSCAEVAEEIARAQWRGLKVWGETCPQYLVLTADDMARTSGRDGSFEGAKFMCSPSPRDAAAQEGLWRVLRQGTLDVVSSDHSGWSFHNDRGKAKHGRDANFRAIPNGVPGVAARLPIMFSEGVSKGRLSLDQFVALTSTNPARLMGLAPRKGVIQVGSDADLAIWDPQKRVTLTNALMQQAIDYTPYEGMEVTGWPVMTVRRGELVMRDGVVTAEPGSGRYLPRAPYDLIRPTGRLPNGFDTAAHAG